MTRACSIDVGKVNLGVYIEEFTSLNSKGLYLQKVDLTEKKSERVTPTFLKRLFDYLDTIRPILNTCDVIVIEKQLRANPEAQFVDHALQSYFVIMGKKVVSFSSKNKTKLFDDSKMTKYQRKKWATQKAIEMLTNRGETELLNYVSSLKKKDDVSDAICQLDAWKVMNGKGESEYEPLPKKSKKSLSIEPGQQDSATVEKPAPKPRKKKEAVSIATESVANVEKPAPTPRKKKVVEKNLEEQKV